MRSRSRISAGIILSTCALVAASASLSGTSATADPGPQRTVERAPSGLVVQAVTQGGTTITTYGVDAPVVTDVLVGEHTATATIGVSGAVPTQFTGVAAQVPPTVYEMSLAAGMSVAEACEFARDMGDGGCRTSAELEQKQRAGAVAAAAAAAPVLDARCFDHKITEGDGTKYNHACVTRVLDFTGTKRKFIATKMKATGWQENGGWYNDSINGVGVQAKYQHDDAFAVDWAPYASQQVGSCRSVSTTVESPRTGTSYSSSSEVCPDRLNPWHSPAFQYFGAKWNGAAAPESERRGVVASSVVSIPRAGTAAYEIGSWLSWT